MTTRSRTDAPSIETPSNQPAFIRRTSSALLVAAFAMLLLGDVLAFNQLATQSPTDAIVQIVVFSIGAAGIIECIRRLAAPTSTCPRRSAIVPGLLGTLALATWRAQLPAGIAVILTIAAAIAWGASTFRLLGGSEADQNTDNRQILGLFSFAQTIVLAYVAVLTAIDAGPTLFG